jgi:hypothetical protein
MPHYSRHQSNVRQIEPSAPVRGLRGHQRRVRFSGGLSLEDGPKPRNLQTLSKTGVAHALFSKMTLIGPGGSLYLFDLTYNPVHKGGAFRAQALVEKA